MNAKRSGVLYVVATPIGNLQDMTFRAIDTLNSVDVILAEDTRVTKELLNYYNIKKTPEKLDRFSEKSKENTIVEKLQAGYNIALVSDAGTPCIKDPGARVLFKCHENNIRVIPIPGPSAITAALSIAGFSLNAFIFVGYAPKKKSEKVKFVQGIKQALVPVLFFETSRRLLALMEILDMRVPKRYIFMARELTKYFETTYFGKIDELMGLFKSGEVQLKLKGEWVVIVDGINQNTLFPDIFKPKPGFMALDSTPTGAKKTSQVIAQILGIPQKRAYQIVHTALKERDT